MKKTITFSQSIEGWQLDANARRLSHNTIIDYQGTFRKFQAFLGGDPPIAEITRKVQKPHPNTSDAQMIPKSPI